MATGERRRLGRLVERGLDDEDDIAVHRSRRVRARTRRSGIRLAQVVHHGSDHRSQICTALTELGHEPPEFDVWAYGETVGLVREDQVEPT